MGHELAITGNNYGQIVNGDNNTVTLTIHGDYIVNPEKPVHPQPIATPVYIRPKSFPDLLDRVAEREEALSSIEKNMTVELSGEPGLGKTALLRYVSYACAGEYCADGVIYVDGRGKPLGDILQFIYDAFHECDVPYKPTEPELLRALQKKRALIVIDDLQAGDDEFRSFANKVPDATFLVASETGCLVQEVDNVDLHGLPFDDALLLIERELRHPLGDDERAAARSLWEICKGKPATLVGIANDAHRRQGTLAEAVARLLPAVPAQSSQAAVVAPVPADQILGSCSDDERRIVAVLAFFDGTPVRAQHLAAITALADIESPLKALAERRVVESGERGYTLVADLVAPFRERLDYESAGRRALDYFAGYAARQWPESSARFTSLAGGTSGVSFNLGLPPGATLDAPLSAAPASAAKAPKSWNPLTLLPDADAILRAIESAAAFRMWRELLAMAPPIDAALALAGRWAARAAMLARALEAAEHTNDDAARAWVLHQQGSLALCIGNNALAQDLLSRALSLREKLGDDPGAAVTSHNLRRITAAPANSGESKGNPEEIRPAPAGGRRMLPWIAAGVLILGLLTFLLWPTAPLAAPSNLRAEWAPGSRAVRLDWVDNSNRETGFQVERGVSDDAFKPIVTLPAGATVFLDTNVRSGTQYIYRVHAVAGSELSDYSNLDTVFIPAAGVPAEKPRATDSIADTVRPANPTATIRLDSFKLDTNYVLGGRRVGATITLSGAAPADAQILLAAEPPDIVAFSSPIVIARGERDARRIIGVRAVERPTKVILTVSYGGAQLRATLVVMPAAATEPPRLTKLGADSSTYAYAKRMVISGIVAIDKPAPAGGMRVLVAITNPWMAQASDSVVTIAAGNNAQRFTIITVPQVPGGTARIMIPKRPPVLRAALTARDPQRNTALVDSLTFQSPTVAPPPRRIPNIQLNRRGTSQPPK